MQHGSTAPPATRAHTPAPLPATWHEQTQHEAEAAWTAGYHQALADIAAGTVELDAAWRPIGRLTQAQRVAARVAQFEECAQRVADIMGRPEGYTYRGGPVTWDRATTPQTGAAA